ncbi:MAG: DMT family transporter [Halarchaeum sp.]
MTSTPSLRGPRASAAMFVALAAFWGTSFVAIEAGIDYFPPLLFAALRYAIAGAVVLAYAVATTDRWRPRTRGDWASVAAGGALVIAAYHGLLYLGQRNVPGAVAAVVVATAPVLTAVFASAVLGDDSVGPVELVGFALGLLGVVVIAAPDASALTATTLLPVGLVFLSAVAFALGGVLTRPFDTTLPARSTQAWTMLVGAAVLLAGAAARGESLRDVTWTPTALGSLAYLTVVSGVFAFLLYFELLDRTGPSTVHLVSYLEPVVATAMSVVVLGHGVAPDVLVGFLAVFAGFAVVERDHLVAPLTDAHRRVRAVRGVHAVRALRDARYRVRAALAVPDIPDDAGASHATLPERDASGRRRTGDPSD